MDINELESYRLSNAVKFHNELNPRLWRREKLRPEVREKLLAIADDFREFLGIDGLDIKDITVSGSNAAYTYTPHSDIDLHLVVDLDNVCDNEVYRELFDAKKYQYNNEHNYKIRGYDVELYVQDSKQPHHSSGIYSIVNDDWVKVPSRQQPTIDDISVKGKYVDLGERIEAAIAAGDVDLIQALWRKVKSMRQAGLDTTGEFGPENLAFKLLRRAGTIEQLKTAVTQAQDHELSLNERQKKKKRTRYGYGGYWTPGFSFGDSEGGDGGGGGESIAETQQPRDIKDILKPFIDSCVEYLGIKQAPTIIIKKDPEWTHRHGTFGQFDTETGSITLAVSGRHVLDILRTLAHELTHARQDELATMPVDAGKTGSPYEDEANAMAGRIMRHWVEKYPEFFKDIPLEESVKDRLAAMAAAACIAGTPGCATTSDAVRGVQAVGTAAQTVKRMGRAGAEEEMMQRLRNELRRRQGQVVPENVNEALDQPYKILRWEKGDYGDVDAIARLDDGTFLSIMFNKGFSQETKEEAWSVEFYRNNSQEVTGEGDEFRVFATVLSAIQTFISDKVPGAIGKYKPNKVYFSASKEVEPGQKEQSRAGLYDSLVQRYARALGFTSSRSDTGNKVMYELNRIKPVVAEGKLVESAVFLNPTTVIVGQAHGRPLELSPNTLQQIQAIAAKHGAWYEGNGTDRGYTKGQIDRYVGSWDDEVAKTASPNDPKWLYVLFANVDANNRVQRVGINPKDTIFNRLLATAKDNSFQGIGYTPQALQKFLQMASEGQYDFVKMSQQPATQENLTRFLKAGEALMWPSNWEQYPNKAGKIAKAATVDVRDQYLATREAGVYVTGSGHLKAVQTITRKPVVAEATGYIPVNSKEARDPRYSMAITQDIQPGEVQRQAAKMGFKTDAAGVPPLLMKLQNQLKEIKAGTAQ